MTRLLAAVLFVAPGGGAAHAQELEARTYAPAPAGTMIVLAGVGGSKGAVLFDPSGGIDDVAADLRVVIMGFGYTFGIAGRQARILGVMPSAFGRFDGVVHGQPQRQDVGGVVDPRIKLSYAWRGGPALKAVEFARAPRQTILGTSVTVMVPLGSYEAARAVNLGYHRWAIKPELGVSRTIRAWTLDAYAGVWLFTTNRRYLPGSARKAQDPLGSLQGHVSYALPRRAWIALDATWFGGGRTTINGAVSPDEQRSTRVGMTLSLPLTREQSVKFTYSSGTSTRRGTDFDNVMITWQLARVR